MNFRRKLPLLMGAILIAGSVGGGAQTPSKVEVTVEEPQVLTLTDSGDDLGGVFVEEGQSKSDAKLSDDEKAKLKREIENLTKDRAKIDAKIRELSKKLGGRVMIYKTRRVNPNGGKEDSAIIEQEVNIENGIARIKRKRGGEEIQELRIEGGEGLSDAHRLKLEAELNALQNQKGLSDKERMKLDKGRKELRIEMKRSLNGHPEVLVVPKFDEFSKDAFVFPKIEFPKGEFPRERLFLFNGEKGEWNNLWSDEYSKAMQEWHEQFSKAMKEWNDQNAQMLREWSEKRSKFMKEWTEKAHKIQEEKLKELKEKKATPKDSSQSESKATPSSAETNSRRAI